MNANRSRLRLASVALFVADLENSVLFYQRLLG
jgi:catechol 2,3-dioxygenase-like lactoylglutathione lyase family enzyme